MSNPDKVSTDGGSGLAQNPFAALKVAPGAAASLPESRVPKPAVPAAPVRNRGRVDIIRETGNRGGKTVTVITGFVGIGIAEKEQLAKKMRAACGCGGTVKEGRIELQGDKREPVAKILSDAGFRPVFAGG